MNFKEIGVCAFLDIEEVFDNASQEAVRGAMCRQNTEMYILWWASEMMHTRLAETIRKEDSVTLSTVKGCPQEIVLSYVILAWC